MSDIEQRIRERAYLLWEQAGMPEGNGEQFWFAAAAEIETEVAPPAEPAVKTAPFAKAARAKPAAPGKTVRKPAGASSAARQAAAPQMAGPSSLA